jgi:hypothetical protein
MSIVSRPASKEGRTGPPRGGGSRGYQTSRARRKIHNTGRQSSTARIAHGQRPSQLIHPGQQLARERGWL